MNIYLVRHGQSAGNVDKSLYFRQAEWDVPLTHVGIDQANAATENILQLVPSYLNPFVANIISSPYIRARDTASIIQKQLNKSPRCIINELNEDPRLRERGWGELRDIVQSGGKTEEHFNFFYRPNGGESFADVYDRVACFHNWLIRHNGDKNIIIVAHGEFNKVYAMFLMRWKVSEFEQWRTPRNGEVMLFNNERLSPYTPLTLKD